MSVLCLQLVAAGPDFPINHLIDELNQSHDQKFMNLCVLIQSNIGQGPRQHYQWSFSKYFILYNTFPSDVSRSSNQLGQFFLQKQTNICIYPLIFLSRAALLQQVVLCNWTHHQDKLVKWSLLANATLNEIVGQHDCYHLKKKCFWHCTEIDGNQKSPGGGEICLVCFENCHQKCCIISC